VDGALSVFAIADVAKIKASANVAIEVFMTVSFCLGISIVTSNWVKMFFVSQLTRHVRLPLKFVASAAVVVSRSAREPCFSYQS
jgi:phage-related baseplate assembly protein